MESLAVMERTGKIRSTAVELPSAALLPLISSLDLWSGEGALVA